VCRLDDTATAAVAYVGVVVVYEMMTSSAGKMDFPKTNGSAIPMVGDTITTDRPEVVFARTLVVDDGRFFSL
jgi:hypothetical protein